MIVKDLRNSFNPVPKRTEENRNYTEKYADKKEKQETSQTGKRQIQYYNKQFR